MPMTLPSMFSSGPPELPGLIEASVWMKSVKVRPCSFDGTERPSAETTPVVTVPLRPKGLPTATTLSPIIRSPEVPIGAVARPFASTRSTATSLSGSTPISFAQSFEPSLKLTLINDAPSTTWLFVTTMPSLDQTKPEPRDWVWYSRLPPKKPKGSKKGSTSRRRMVASVWMFTTAGRTSCATTTTGVRRAALTDCGIGARSCRGCRTVCDSVGRQARETTKRTMRRRKRFMSRSYGLSAVSSRLAGATGEALRAESRELRAFPGYTLAVAAPSHLQPDRRTRARRPAHGRGAAASARPRRERRAVRDEERRRPRARRGRGLARRGGRSRRDLRRRRLGAPRRPRL